MSQDKVVDEIVAVVGNNIILKSDIEQQYLQMQVQGYTTDGDMKCEILEQFLESKLLMAEAALDTTIEVTDGQVNGEMERRLQMYRERIGSDKDIEKFFKQSMSDIKSSLDDNIRQQIITQQMRSKITEGVTSTPAEVRRYVKDTKSSKLPKVPGQLEYEQILVTPVVSEEAVLQVKNRLRQIKKRVEDGSSFATMAVLYSQGPSAANGGELGFMGKGQLDPAYAEAAFNLEKGVVSNVVKSDFGYHIIQMIEKKGGKANTRHILMRPKVGAEAKTTAKSRIDSIVDLINANKLTWKVAAFKYSNDKDSKNNSGLVINQANMSSKFNISELPPQDSKVLANMNVGEISKPYWAEDPRKGGGSYKIIRLVTKTKEHIANPQEDYQVLYDQFLAQKKEDVYKVWIKEHMGKTYVRIDQSYANCNFNNTWAK
ncbi:peptidylprolyl isomerase [Halosquirtibacter laminarini]|uniref:Peptidylprolyl isomerase n=1 Tax=Halosquirtibacter laminarini TaxID=3374600 RepID=A0AC61NNA4_9BACT|nr:peptidylprolyl isomerase [Prolixibacteraceae bacterium]